MADEIQVTYIQDLPAAAELSDSDLFLIHQSGNEKSLAYSSLFSQFTGRIVGPPVVYKSSGTYTPSAGVTKVYIELVGGGGGGGYGGTSNVGQGGGGGGLLKKLTAVTGSVSVIVGTGGIGGTSSVQATAGGSTSFGTYTVTGGGSGGYNGTTGGAGGSSSTGDVNLPGGQGAGGIAISGATSYLGGFGGSVPGYSVSPGYTQNGNGAQTWGYGSGGGGGSNNGTGTAGRNGIVVIWEYS